MIGLHVTSLSLYWDIRKPSSVKWESIRKNTGRFSMPRYQNERKIYRARIFDSGISQGAIQFVTIERDFVSRSIVSRQAQWATRLHYTLRAGSRYRSLSFELHCAFPRVSLKNGCTKPYISMVALGSYQLGSVYNSFRYRVAIKKCNFPLQLAVYKSGANSMTVRNG